MSSVIATYGLVLSLVVAGGAGGQSWSPSDVCPIEIDQSKIFPAARAICGVNCLYMVCRLSGVPVEFRELYRRIPIDPAHGTSMLALKRVAESLGFTARGEELGIEELTRVRLPAIAHLKQDHFVVIVRLNDDAVWIADPPASYETMSMAQFRDLWTGRVLILQPRGNNPAATTATPAVSSRPPACTAPASPPAP